MITFMPTLDLELIKNTLMAPNNLPWQFEDDFDRSSFDRLELLPETCTCIASYCGNVFWGLFLLVGKGEKVFECHLALLPLAYGKSVPLGKCFVDWIWNHTKAESIEAPVIADNRLACSMVEKVGFRNTSRCAGKWLKGGFRHDLIVYEINKPIMV